MKFPLLSVLFFTLFLAFPFGAGLYGQPIVDVVFSLAQSQPDPNSGGNFHDWENVVPPYEPATIFLEDGTQVSTYRAAVENELLLAGPGNHYFEYNSSVHGRLFYVATVE
ncbi:MAG: hypothetical protein AAFZ52_18415 [Bacteroidota bacterium]